MTHPPGPAMTSPREIGQRAREVTLPDREITARAIYERYPFYMAESSGVMQHSMTVSTKFDWDAAPAYYQHDCYDLADAIIRAHQSRLPAPPVSDTGERG